jgi:hypothetical protein
MRAEPLMNTDLAAGPHWSTSSFAADTEAVDSELPALAEHLALCRRLSGHLFALRCGADAVHRFVAPRLVTTVVLAGALIGAVLALS